MNILLDAWLDTNFGDDFFLTWTARHYPEHRFYITIDHCPPHVQPWTQKIPNLFLFPDDDMILDSGMFDLYIMIGGDMFHDYPDGFGWRIRRMEAIKKTGGYIALLGFNLFELNRYHAKAYNDMIRIFDLADDIFTRDSRTAELLRSMPLQDKAKIRDGADMAFNYVPGALKKHKSGHSEQSAWAGESERISNLNHVSVQEHTNSVIPQERCDTVPNAQHSPILGISVRRKLNVTEEQYAAYVNNMASIAAEYIRDKTEGSVHILCLSTGEFDDRKCAEDVRARAEKILCEQGSQDDTETASRLGKRQAKIQNRIRIITYTGDIPAFIQEMTHCSAIVATRFHAMIFALLLHKPVLPVIYEDKLQNVLQEIHYTGYSFYYEDSDPDMVRTMSFLEEAQPRDSVENVGGNKKVDLFPYDLQSLISYTTRASYIFDQTDAWIRDHSSRTISKSLALNVPVFDRAAALSERDQKIRIMQDQIARQQEQVDQLSHEKEELQTLKEDQEREQATLLDVHNIAGEYAGSRIYRFAHWLLNVAKRLTHGQQVAEPFQEIEEKTSSVDKAQS